MADTMGVTQAANFIPEVWAATALGALRANSVMARLVNRDFENMVAGQGDIIHIPVRGALTVSDKVSGSAVTLQNPTATKVDVTLNKHKEISFLVEDIAKAQANQDMISGYIEDAVIALAEQIDSDLIALYAGLSTHTAIDGTGGLSEANVREARRLLNTVKVPMTNRHIVWHEDAEYALLGVEKFTSATWGAEGDTIKEATIGRRFGFNHFMDQNIAVASTECKNIAFHRDAFVLVTRPLPAIPAGLGAHSAVMDEDGVGLRVIWSYSPDQLGVQVTLDVLYGVAEMRDNHAVVIRTSEI